MAFSQQVREQALVACGRHCCLCHRFVGVKIECHHITPESQGGPDSLDNCIPLCFECHAEVMHYNPNHPKGTRFQPTELRSHRDGWFKKMAMAPPAIFDVERREVDRCVFRRFREMLPEEEARDLFHDHCWGQGIREASLTLLYELDRYLERLDAEFLDPACEGLRASFAEAFRRFLTSRAFQQISRSRDVPGLYGLPKEWNNDPDANVRGRFMGYMNELNGLSTEVYKQYCSVTCELRRLLVVE